ncbi:MAG: LOG family protein [Elusimicrobiota bacterium]
MNHYSKELNDRREKLLKSKAYIKAYEDIDFLKEDEQRPIRLQLELLKPEQILHQHGIKHTVVCFGSARTFNKEEAQERVAFIEKLLRKKPQDKSLKSKLKNARVLLKSAKYYEEARRFAYMAGSKFISGNEKLTVVTGGGPGIMEAANRGAYEAGEKNIGLNITLPMEQGANPYISEEFCFRFHYFAIRKMHFVMRARALVVFPGGFGTMDELFEVLTLVQTGKKRKLPIILFGPEYWENTINFKNMADWGYIAYEDTGIFKYAETAEEAWDIIEDFYREHPLD